MKFKTIIEMTKYLSIFMTGLLIGMVVSYKKIDHVNLNLPRVVLDSPSTLVQSSAFEESRHESTFISTIRSCLGGYCFDQKVDVGDSLISRVGVLAPPMAGMETVLWVVSTFGEVKDLKSIQFVGDSHVPAYGYGKNHGWSSIVRIVRRLVPHAFSLLKNDPNIDTEMFDSQIRQLMRWHCRLSHVAAHTRMLTVFAEDLLARPTVEFDRIASFVGVRLNREKFLSSESLIVNRFLSELLGDNSSSNLVQTRLSAGQATLGDIPSGLWTTGSTAMEGELRQSNNLSQWPCKFFRDIDKRLARMQHQPLPYRASSFATNCSAPFVKCSVQYDFAGG